MFRRKPTFTPEAAIEHAFGLLEQGGHPATVLRWLERQKVPAELLAAACHERGTTAAAVFGLDVPEPATAPEPEEEPGLRYAASATPADLARCWPIIQKACGEKGIVLGHIEHHGDQGWYCAPQEVRTLQLAPNIKPTDGERLAAQLGEEMELLTFDPYRRVATAGVLSPMEARVRRTIAASLSCRPWELDITLVYTVEGADHPIELVAVTGEAVLQMSRAKVGKALGEALTAGIPGGSEGWDARWDAETSTALLVYGELARLPELVELLPMLPSTQAAWFEIPLGLDAHGREAILNLKNSPHALVVGPTGAGKTVGLVSAMSQCLLRGHDVVMVDAMKGGLDFIRLRPFTAGWAETLDEAAVIVRAAYAEMERRKAVMKRHQVAFWDDLPVEVKRQEHIAPLSIFIDEFVSLVMAEAVPKGLPKDDPLVEEINARNGMKAIILTYVGKLAREARFSGIHLWTACQRPDATILSGELRANLTSAVQLCKPGAIPSREALAMVFSGEQAPRAGEVLGSLSDGRRGLAVVASDGGDLQGFRVAWAPMSEVAENIAERLGDAQRWQLPISQATPEPQVRYLPADGEVVTVAAFDPTDDASGEVDLTALVTGASEGLWD